MLLLTLFLRLLQFPKATATLLKFLFIVALYFQVSISVLVVYRFVTNHSKMYWLKIMIHFILFSLLQF